MHVHPKAFVISSCVFVFNWVVSLVVAVVWADMFSLAFPEMSTSVGGALCYVVVASLAFPAVALAVMRHELKPSARKLPTTTLDVVPHPGGVAVTQKVLAVRSGGTAILLISALGTGESKAYSSFATSLAKALRVYDSVTNIRERGPQTLLFAVALAVVVSATATAIQVAAVRAGAAARPGSYAGMVYKVLLTSFWSTVGFMWNNVWKVVASLVNPGGGMGNLCIRAALTVLVFMPIGMFIVPKESAAGSGLWRERSVLTARMTTIGAW